VRIVAWDHPRAVAPLSAAASAWGDTVITCRSLASFGDEVPVADGADLVLIDHPHIGEAAQSGALIALDSLIARSDLRAIANRAVGGSGEVYEFQGSCWAVPVDAACHGMAAVRSLAAPATLTDLVAASASSRLALPLHPAHAVSAFITVAATLGAPTPLDALTDATLARDALSVLAAVAACGPDDAYAWEPPDALAAVEAGDVDCVPFVYGYVGYDVEWHEVPARARGAAPRPILGGVGMAVLASCPNPLAAAEFAVWYASTAVQRDIVLTHGGQPATLDAWAIGADPVFRGTARGMANAIARPRDPWWPALQRDAGEAIAEGLRGGLDERVLAERLAGIAAGAVA
jgi:multiple sugar transport system substrate-binding protein